MNEDARSIFRENVIGAVATVNEDGSPWVSPIHIFSDDEAVYWFSDEDKQHSVNIARDPRVSLTLFSPDASKGTKGVYLQGVAQKLNVNETTQAKQLMVKKIGKILPVFDKSAGYRLKIGDLNRGKSTGNCWYFYS